MNWLRASRGTALTLLLTLLSLPSWATVSQSGQTDVIPVFTQLIDETSGQTLQQTYTASPDSPWQLRIKADTFTYFNCNGCSVTQAPMAEGVEYFLSPKSGTNAIVLEADGSFISPHYAKVFANGRLHNIEYMFSTSDKKEATLPWFTIVDSALDLFENIHSDRCICPDHSGGRASVDSADLTQPSQIEITLKDLYSHTATRPLFGSASLGAIELEVIPDTPSIVKPTSIFPEAPHLLCISDQNNTGRQSAINGENGGGRASNGKHLHIKIICYNKKKEKDSNDEDSDDESSTNNRRGSDGGRRGGGDGRKWKKNSWERTLHTNRYKAAGSLGFITGAWLTIAVVTGQCTAERERAERENKTEGFACGSASWAGPVFTVVGSVTSTLFGQGVLLTGEILYYCYCKKNTPLTDVEARSTHTQ